MGLSSHVDGVAVQEHGTPNSKTYKLCWMTPGPPRKVGVGSEDWLHDVYLADNDQDLYTLMRNSTPAVHGPSLTSAASQDVVFHTMENGLPKTTSWMSVIASGEIVDVPGPGGKIEKLMRVDLLTVASDDVTQPEHPLREPWNKAVPYRNID